MNYYSQHIGDYRRDTAHLSLLEHGVYRQLLDMYYLSEEKISKETDLVFRRLCARTEDEKNAVLNILKEFFTYDDGWVHKRCESEIQAYKSKANRAKENGKLGGRPPKTKEVIYGFPEETKEKANHKPITNNQEPLTSKEIVAPQAADPVIEIFEYWKITLKHPKARLDDKRKKLINNALKLGYEPNDLMDAIEGCSKSPYHMGCDGRNTTLYDDLELILRDAKHIDQFLKINLTPLVPSGVIYGSHQQASRQRGLDPDDTSWIDRVYGPESSTSSFVAESSIQVIEGNFPGLDSRDS